MIAPHPGRVLAHHLHHPVDDRLAAPAAFHVLHLVEQPVELRILVARLVLAVLGAVRPIEQEHEVFRVRIVGVPAEREHLGVAQADLLLKAVPVGGADLKLQVDLGELPAIPGEPRGILGPTLGGVQIENQRLPRLRVAPVRISRLGEKPSRGFDGLALRPAVDPVVHHRVVAPRLLAVAEDSRRQRPHSGDAAAVGEDRDEFLPVHRDRHRLAQPACALVRACVALAAAHHSVVEIEREIEGRRRDGSDQADPAILHLGGQRGVAGDADAHRLIEIVRADARRIVVALQKLVPERNALLLPGQHDALDEGHALAGVGEQPRRRVARRALGRIGLAAEIRIGLEHDAEVGVVLGQHERARADRIRIEGQVAPVVHGALRIEAVRFPRHRREERHRQPVHELRVLAPDANAVGIAVEGFHARELVSPQVDPGAAWVRGAVTFAVLGHQRFVVALQGHAQLLQADDVVGHVTVDGRHHSRMGEPLDLVDVVVRRQLPRAGLRKIRQPVLRAYLALGQREIRGLALVVFRKRGMRLIEDPLSNADVVLAVRDTVGRSVPREHASSRVEKARLRNLGRGGWDELVRPLEVMILQRSLVDLLDDVVFVRGIRLGRIQVLWPFDEEGVEDVFPALPGGIRIVPDAATAGERDRQECHERVSAAHRRKV